MTISHVGRYKDNSYEPIFANKDVHEGFKNSINMKTETGLARKETEREMRGRRQDSKKQK